MKGRGGISIRRLDMVRTCTLTLYKNSAVQSQHMNMLASSCMEYIFARCITKSQEEIERSLCYLALCYSANELWHIFCL